MAASDATPRPIKNQAYRVSFPIYDNDGDLVAGAAGLDSEVSKDAGTYADCTNEATEIAPSSGTYYLDLTATEMDANTVVILVKTSTTNAKTTPIFLYPEDKGLVVRSAVNDASATTTGFVTDLTEATDDHYNGRLLIFTSGNLLGQSRYITDYNGTTKGVTVEALTEAPADNDEFVIV